MMPTELEIEEIADFLENGMDCFYHLQTGEMIILINHDSCFESEDERWSEDWQKIKDNPNDYFEFIGYDSSESYEMMADFTELVENDKLKNSLITAINQRHPFRNFKRIIDSSDEYLERWFDFKKKCYIEHVKAQIKAGKVEFQ